ncbi:ABC transporter substrate-binding protein [Candidatus Gracilibacteria bacterium]|nr:ABC transporter substrate-binding protein [Candidatus Gracilibacteria bacterium]
MLAACGSQPAAQSPAAPAPTNALPRHGSACRDSEDLPPLRIVTSFQIASLNPVDDGFWMPEFGVGELMMQFRADGQHYLWLLEELEQIDDVTWRLHLREGITFQNGAPLDAAALAALINRQMELSSSAQSNFAAGTTAEVTGELEVTLNTVAPNTGVIPALADEAVFPVYDVAAVEAAGENVEQLIGAGIYTGPYSVVSLNEQEMLLERYEGYWQGMPALPGVSVRFVSDPQARILAVQNDEADIALYPPTAAKPVVDAQDGIFFNFGTPSTGGFRMVLNIQEPPFNDMAVRQAIIRAINYDELANDVMDGVFVSATSYYPPFFDFALANQRTDVAEATRLLDEGGWLPGADGVRAKDSEPLRVILLIYPQQPDLTPISEAIQAQLSDLGFAVEIRSVDSINDALGPGGEEWDAGLVSAGAVTFGGAPEPTLRRSFVTGGDRNYAGFSNAELDALAEELSRTFDSQRRTEILQRLQVIKIEEEPYQFFVNHHTGRVVVNERYRDYQPGFALYHVSYTTRPSE